MIELVYEHSYAEDYWQLSHINVRMENASEKAKIEDKIKMLNVEGMLGYPSKTFKKQIAMKLNLDEECILVDTIEIDVM